MCINLRRQASTPTGMSWRPCSQSVSTCCCASASSSSRCARSRAFVSDQAYAQPQQPLRKHLQRTFADMLPYYQQARHRSHTAAKPFMVECLDAGHRTCRLSHLVTGTKP